MKDLWTEYEARTMLRFDRDPELISSKFTMELLCVQRLVGPQNDDLLASIRKIMLNNSESRFKSAVKSIMAEEGLTSFADHGKTDCCELILAWRLLPSSRIASSRAAFFVAIGP